MKRLVLLILVTGLILSGCSTWLDGSYHSIKPHEEKENQSGSEMVAVSSYAALYRTLVNMVHNGTLSGIISVKNYNQLVVARDMRYAIDNVRLSDPISAYAVEAIHFELGTNAGQPAIAVSIDYYHDRTELQKIHHLENMTQAEEAIGSALDGCDSGIVVYVVGYQDYDFVQWVEDYSSYHVDRVMETPQVTVNIYPEGGVSRVVELKFTYQNSRESLRTMQEQVERLLTKAVNEARLQDAQGDKVEKLYSALIKDMTSYDTSITPAYSLLAHGVGDSKAVSTVFRAMCDQAELNCVTVTGTYQGQPRYWNILQIDGAYFHADLLRSREEGTLRLMTDSEMSGYVWDYSTYPVCSGDPELREDNTQ